MTIFCRTAYARKLKLGTIVLLINTKFFKYPLIIYKHLIASGITIRFPSDLLHFSEVLNLERLKIRSTFLFGNPILLRRYFGTYTNFQPPLISWVPKFIQTQSSSFSTYAVIRMVWSNLLSKISLNNSPSLNVFSII